MKAIFTGTLAAGFGIQEVVVDEAATVIVAASLAKGELAEALGIQSPKSLNQQAVPPFEGINYVVFGTGLGNGFEVFGPFPSVTKAETFGENYCGDGGKWEVFVAPESDDDDDDDDGLDEGDDFGPATTQEGEVDCPPEVMDHSSAKQVDDAEARVRGDSPTG
jgi:hypothetical protein